MAISCAPLTVAVLPNGTSYPCPSQTPNFYAPDQEFLLNDSAQDRVEVLYTPVRSLRPSFEWDQNWTINGINGVASGVFFTSDQFINKSDVTSVFGTETTFPRTTFHE